MASNDHTCEVRETSDDFPQTPTLTMLPFLGHMEGGYLAASLLGEGNPMTLPIRPSGRGLLSGLPSGGRRLSDLPPLGQLEGGHVYKGVSLMRVADPMNLPLEAATTLHFP